MSAADPRPKVGQDGHVLSLASSPEPAGVTSNIGHPREPVVIGVSVDGERPFLTISEGSGHLGSGAALWLEQVLEESRDLQPRWVPGFVSADAMWLVPYLARLVNGERITEQDLVDAYVDRHGHPPPDHRRRV